MPLASGAASGCFCQPPAVQVLARGSRPPHLIEAIQQCAVPGAVRASGVDRHVTWHVIRRFPVTHLLESGSGIRTPGLPGHSGVRAAQGSTRLLSRRRTGDAGHRAAPVNIGRIVALERTHESHVPHHRRQARHARVPP